MSNPTRPPFAARAVIAACLLLVAALASSTASARGKDHPPPDDPLASEPASPITDHLSLRADWLGAHITTTGHVDPSATTTGTAFDGERDFGLPASARQLRPELMFRLRNRSRVRLSFFDLDRQAVANPSKPLVYGGSTFLVTDRVRTHATWRQMDFAYTYSLLRASRYELGVGLGMHLLQAEAEARVPERQLREDYSGSGPFPTVVLDGSVRIARRWSLEARGEYLSVTVRNVKGRMADYSASVQYRWKPNFALGLGYRSQQVELQVKNEDPSGLLDMSVAGPSAFVRVSL